MSTALFTLSEKKHIISKVENLLYYIIIKKYNKNSNWKTVIFFQASLMSRKFKIYFLNGINIKTYSMYLKKL